MVTEVKRSTNDEMSARTKAELLQAAVRLFSARGYAQTTLQQVVDAAGLSKGAFYHHFRNKEEILRLINDETLAYLLAASQAVVDAGDPPVETMRKLIRVQMTAVETRQDAVALMIRELHSFGPENWAAVKADRDRLEGLFVSLIEAGRRAGDFRPDGDARLIAFGILGMFHWAYEWYKPGRVSAGEIANLYADMVLSGLESG